MQKVFKKIKRKESFSPPLAFLTAFGFHPQRPKSQFPPTLARLFALASPQAEIKHFG
jgi:hypothetical protein